MYKSLQLDLGHARRHGAPANARLITSSYSRKLGL